MLYNSLMRQVELGKHALHHFGLFPLSLSLSLFYYHLKHFKA